MRPFRRPITMWSNLGMLVVALAIDGTEFYVNPLLGIVAVIVVNIALTFVE